MYIANGKSFLFFEQPVTLHVDSTYLVPLLQINKLRQTHWQTSIIMAEESWEFNNSIPVLPALYSIY